MEFDREHLNILGTNNRIGTIKKDGETFFLLLNEERLSCENTSIVMKSIGDATLSKRLMRTIRAEYEMTPTRNRNEAKDHCPYCSEKGY